MDWKIDNNDSAEADLCGRLWALPLCVKPHLLAGPYARRVRTALIRH